MAEDEQSLLKFVTGVCGAAALRGEGLIFAIEDGYATNTQAPVSDVFLRVDAEAAHHPASTFRSKELAALLEDAVLPTVGVLNAEAEDAESWALKVGYARDRVIGYQRIKAAALHRACLGDALATVRKELHDCEENVMGKAGWHPAAEQYNMMKRTAWDQREDHDRTPSLMDNALATGINQAQLIGLATGNWTGEEEVDNAVRDKKLGTERFVSFVFAPSDHEVMVAANATGGGLRLDETTLVYPAYVTVHNSKGAIEHLPATAAEPQPNSVIVPCAASLICELHSLSSKAGRNPVLVAHTLKLE